MGNQLTVKGIYGSGMVLQRNTVNCIFGTAIKNSTVSVIFRNNLESNIVDNNGNWKILFNSGDKGGPFQLSVKTDTDEILYDDVYVGEVWVNSGQSNAQLPMSRMKFSYPDEFQLAKNENIRMITIPIKYSFDGEKDSVENPTWICASPQTLGEMSGTGYFFAKKLAKELDLPIGIINASQGGSPIESWMNEDSLKKIKDEKYFERLEFCKNPKNITNDIEISQKKAKEWNDSLQENDIGLKEDWLNVDMNKVNDSWTDFQIPGKFKLNGESGIVWFKREIELTKSQVEKFNNTQTFLWLGTIIDSDEVWVNGIKCGETPYTYPPRRYEVKESVLKEGKNQITIRVKSNSGNVVFFEEKPYFLFTKDNYVNPVAYRNVERHNKTVVGDTCIDLSGKWMMNIGVIGGKCPSSVFYEWQPTALYNSMLAPCFNYAIKGALWYQGESNAMMPNEYKGLLKEMISLWRSKFIYSEKDFSFIVVQLPNWSDGNNEFESELNCGWAEMRNNQLSAVEETVNTGLSVLIDGGEWNDLHPEKKFTVGTRSALEALRIGYDEEINCAPKIVLCYKDKDSYKIRFDCDKSELVCFDLSNGEVDFETISNNVKGFALVVRTLFSEKIINVEAKLISKNEVEVKIPKIKGKLLELRYLWASSPKEVNLYNKDLLPTIPGRFIINYQ
jgi:sialate O-acetylesterase